MHAARLKRRPRNRRQSWGLSPLCWGLPLVAWLIGASYNVLAMAGHAPPGQLMILTVGIVSISLVLAGVVLSLIGLVKSFRTGGILISAVLGLLLGGAYAVLFANGVMTALDAQGAQSVE